VKPIPVVFHIGPLQVHTYGIGLAVTFWFAYRYFARRLRAHGYPDAWLGKAFVWIIVAAIVGARAVSVISNWSEYSHDLAGVFAVWHGGLSSFGGLLLAVPVGFWCAHRWCPQLRAVVAADQVAVVLVLAWGVGRLLGPQLMYQGGGYQTNAWYGMYYAGEAGKRLPVPIFQALECFAIWLIVLQIEKLVRRRGGPLGLVATAVVSLWGLSRVNDETLLLPHTTSGDLAVIGAAWAFVTCGAALAGWLLWRDRRRRVLLAASAADEKGAASSEAGKPGTDPESFAAGDPWASPFLTAGDLDDEAEALEDGEQSPAGQPKPDADEVSVGATEKTGLS
jgi:phosphatidylglycerol:prolipoprotein diacylglycerol transferase